MLIAPKRRPQEFGFKQGDSHLIVNAASKTVKAYAFGGKLLWEKPCLADGQHPNWRNKNGDTPPGLYKLGDIHNDFAIYGSNPSFTETLLQYGWIFFDLVDLEGNEDNNDRAGAGLHGGGSACGWDGAWQPRQVLYPTLGCVRMHNIDLRDFLLPLTGKGTVFVSVFQDDK